MEVSKNDLPIKKEQLNPNIYIHILFGPHKTESDVKPIENRFKTADIYIPESFGWTAADLKQFKAVSGGEITPAQYFQTNGLRRVDCEFLYAQLEMVKNSHKPIGIIDIPKEHVSPEALSRFAEGLVIAPGSFDNQLQQVKIWLKDKAEFQIKREAYMQSMLPVKIKEILDEYPELKGKGNLNVLVSLGSHHVRLYAELKKAGYDVEKEEVPYYGYSMEGLMVHMSGREIGDELAAKIFLEEQFATSYEKSIDGITDNFTDILHLRQKIISQFNFEEAREIFEAIKRGRDLRVVFENKLKEKGIKFPQSGGQLKWFLKPDV